MDRKFRIRFYGNDRSIALPLLQAFGEMKFYDPAEDPANFQVLIIEGETTPELEKPGLLNTLFDAGKTLGFLYSTAKQLDVLAACTGRLLSLEGKSIFVRRFPESHEKAEKFGYTVLPDYSRERLLEEYRHNKNDIYNELSQKVFQELTSDPVYTKPPPATIRLYPINNDYSALHGSWANIYNNQVSLPLGQSIGNALPPAATFLLKLDSYAYLANASGGDNNYHLILHPVLSELIPVSFYTDNSGAFPVFFRYQYQLSIQLNTNSGRGVNLQPTVPNENSCSQSNSYGWNIFTNFPSPSLQQKIIPIKGRDENGDPIIIDLQPLYQSMIGQMDFLCIQNYFSYNQDSGNRSQVGFNNRDYGYYDTTPGSLEMISYFIVNAVEGETSCPVQLEVSIAVTVQSKALYGSGWNTQWGQNFPLASLTVDLAQRTKEQNYNPPPAGS